MTGGEKCDVVMQLTVKQAQNQPFDRCLTV
uniref:Uncharacterized protein n=1 Tax=Siphoviridae sp. ctFbs2 TaxID=2826213 RepID=A0A8S5NN61_9CAUD|nr:MAG TPA: hypothetical protein [Siphoviridae sp. ctFbs2]